MKNASVDAIVFRSSSPEVFLGKGVLKICSKFTGKHPCRSAISVKLLCSYIEVGLRHGCPPVNLHIFRAPLFKNTYGGLLQSVTSDDWVNPSPNRYFMLFKCLVYVCVFFFFSKKTFSWNKVDYWPQISFFFVFLRVLKRC